MTQTLLKLDYIYPAICTFIYTFIIQPTLLWHDHQAKTKTYDIPSIHKSASLGELGPTTTLTASPAENFNMPLPSPTAKDGGFSKDGHDLRGTRHLMQLYNAYPAVLEPQALTR